jgi:hypothetical protein
MMALENGDDLSRLLKNPPDVLGVIDVGTAETVELLVDEKDDGAGRGDKLLSEPV